MSATTPETPRPQAMVPDLCRNHQHDLIVQRLAIPPHGAWRAAVIVANILLFQGTTASARFHARVGDDFAGNASLVLAEIGCLACFDLDLYQRVCRVMEKGLDHAALVSRGKIADEGFDLTKGKAA